MINATDIQQATAIVPDAAGIMQPLAVGLPPDEAIAQQTKIARALTKVVEDRNLSVPIKDRRYLKVEAWQTLALLMGCTVREVGVKPIEGGYEAEAEVVRIDTGAVVGRGSSVCMRAEPRWRDQPDYAVRSMAATRAISKAARNTFAGIVALGSRFETTPFEEMDGVASDRGRRQRRTTTAPRQRRPENGRVLGRVGSDRLLRRLDSLNRTFTDLLHGLRDHEPEVHPLCTGVEVSDIPAEALEGIGRQLEWFAQDHATEPVAASSDDDDIDESQIPF